MAPADESAMPARSLRGSWAVESQFIRSFSSSSRKRTAVVSRVPIRSKCSLHWRQVSFVTTAALFEGLPSRFDAYFAHSFALSATDDRTLATALEHDDLEQRESARTTLRGFIDHIVIPPGDALLQVVGSLGEMLTAAGAPREAAAVGKGICGGPQPSIPTDLTIPTALYVVAA